MNAPKPFPQSSAAEQALLGGLILDPRQLRTIAGTVRQSDFYRPEHGELYSLLQDMQRKGKAIDQVTVAEAVSRADDDEQYGGLGYVLDLPEQVPSTTNLQHYADVVRDKADKRRLLKLGHELVERGYAEQDSASTIATDTAGKLRGMVSDGGGGLLSKVKPLASGLDDTVEHADRVSRGDVPWKPRPKSKAMQDIVGYWEPGLHILGARPAMGKSTYARENIGVHFAQAYNRFVLMFPLEMTIRQLAEGKLSTDTGIGRDDLQRPLTGPEWDSLMNMRAKLRGLPIHAYDGHNVTVEEIVAVAWSIYDQQKDTEQPLGCALIDYLQLVNLEIRKGETKTSAFGRVSRALHILGLDLGVPVFGLAQLNRGLESRADKRPRMADLRDCGEFEQDAVTITFIYRDEVYDDTSADTGIAELGVAKNRFGPTGVARLAFKPPRVMFLDEYGAHRASDAVRGVLDASERVDPHETLSSLMASHGGAVRSALGASDERECNRIAAGIPGITKAQMSAIVELRRESEA